MAAPTPTDSYDSDDLDSSDAFDREGNPVDLNGNPVQWVIDVPRDIY